jgi:hypothetical protein
LTSFVDVGADDQGGGEELITYQKCPYTFTFTCPAAQFPVVLRPRTHSRVIQWFRTARSPTLARERGREGGSVGMLHERSCSI